MNNINILNRGLKLVVLSFVLVFYFRTSYSQCLSKEIVGLELNKNELKIDLSKFSGAVTAHKLRLYNYETTDDFISVSLMNADQAKLDFNNNEKQIIINNIPEGEYLLIFENVACENIYVGEGFSGFPYSGIRIE